MDGNGASRIGEGRIVLSGDSVGVPIPPISTLLYGLRSAIDALNGRRGVMPPMVADVKGKVRV